MTHHNHVFRVVDEATGMYRKENTLTGFREIKRSYMYIESCSCGLERAWMKIGNEDKATMTDINWARNLIREHKEREARRAVRKSDIKEVKPDGGL